MTKDQKKAAIILGVGAVVALLLWLLNRRSEDQAGPILYIPSGEMPLAQFQLGAVSVPPFTWNHVPPIIPDFGNIDAGYGVNSIGACCSSCRDMENAFAVYSNYLPANGNYLPVTVPYIPLG